MRLCASFFFVVSLKFCSQLLLCLVLCKTASAGDGGGSGSHRPAYSHRGPAAGGQGHCAGEEILLHQVSIETQRHSVSQCGNLLAIVFSPVKESFTSRNNVLHLWPWVIEDLKSLGAKNFYPRFCTGTMNHISIRSVSFTISIKIKPNLENYRRLQCILLKTALCFGIEVYGGVGFESLVEPEFEVCPFALNIFVTLLSDKFMAACPPAGGPPCRQPRGGCPHRGRGEACHRAGFQEEGVPWQARHRHHS